MAQYNHIKKFGGLRSYHNITKHITNISQTHKQLVACLCGLFAQSSYLRGLQVHQDKIKYI